MLSTARRESTFRSSPQQIFSVLILISLAIWWRSLEASFLLALHDDQYTHILLILPVSIALIFIDWESPESPTKFGLTTGSGLLATSVLVAIVARLRIFPLHPDEQLSLNMMALVVWWMATFILSFGVRAFRRALFPLCFLLWIIPPPQSILNPIIRLLQDGSVASARLLFASIGVPYVTEGTRITIPGLTIEVARECSSIRSSLMLVVTTMVVTHVLLRSAWRKVLVIAVAIPLSVAKNGLRIFVLAMLATRVNRSFLTGNLHHRGGIIYFLIALAFVGLLDLAGRRMERTAESATR